MWAAMISAFFTGVGGAILACYLTLVEPDTFLGVQVSTQFLIIAIVGGLGTLGGPVVGAFLATPVAEFLRSVIGSEVAGSLHQFMYGVFFLLVMIFLPRGVGPELRAAGIAARRLARGQQEGGLRNGAIDVLRGLGDRPGLRDRAAHSHRGRCRAFRRGRAVSRARCTTIRRRRRRASSAR